MSRRQFLEVEGAEIEAVDDDDKVAEVLDDHVFTEDEDPTDRCDEFRLNIRLMVRSRSDIETLRNMLDANAQIVITTEGM